MKQELHNLCKMSHLCKKTTSTSTSSRSSCKKSLRKCDTDSYVMCPHTTICLKMKTFLLTHLLIKPALLTTHGK